MAKKYYAVKKGLTPGIYTNWDTCKAQVSSFSGAEYKGFATLKEAETYLGIDSTGDFSDKAHSGDPDMQADGKAGDSAITLLPGTALAYVDGSYRESSKKFSYGIVFFSCGTDGVVSEQHFNRAFSNPELLEMRNVSGEIMGAAQAMKTAREMGLSEITIYHDYEGIAKWCLGLWKANKPWVKKYKAFYDDISSQIKISFVKVKGHSNDRYNDLADELAKAALED